MAGRYIDMYKFKLLWNNLAIVRIRVFRECHQYIYTCILPSVTVQVIFAVNDVTVIRSNMRTTNGVIHLISSCFATNIQVSSFRHPEDEHYVDVRICFNTQNIQSCDAVEIDIGRSLSFCMPLA